MGLESVKDTWKHQGQRHEADHGTKEGEHGSETSSRWKHLYESYECDGRVCRNPDAKYKTVHVVFIQIKSGQRWCVS